MNLEIVVIHVLLAVFLFFLVNWLGRHSITSGYIQLSLFARADEAPAFNFVFRLLVPAVYLVLVAALCYTLGLDPIVSHLWLVALYYVVGRWIFNVAIGRGRLLNWPAQVLVAICIVCLAFVIYDRFIVVRRNLLPDPANLTNELWLAVLIFLYQIANRVTLPRTATIARKQRYLRREYESAVRRFGAIIDCTTSDVRLRTFIYAVLIYENFNRPPLYRWLERHVLYPLGWASSTGIMQVQAARVLSDGESVRRGATHLMELYERSVQEVKGEWRSAAASFNLGSGGNVLSEVPPHLMQQAMFAAASKYNIRSDYSSEVHDVYSDILQVYHPELRDHSYSTYLDSPRPTALGDADLLGPNEAGIDRTGSAPL
jgi:hypothetical protein